MYLYNLSIFVFLNTFCIRDGNLFAASLTWWPGMPCSPKFSALVVGWLAIELIETFVIPQEVLRHITQSINASVLSTASNSLLFFCVCVCHNKSYQFCQLLLVAFPPRPFKLSELQEVYLRHCWDAATLPSIAVFALTVSTTIESN